MCWMFKALITILALIRSHLAMTCLICYHTSEGIYILLATNWIPTNKNSWDFRHNSYQTLRIKPVQWLRILYWEEQTLKRKYIGNIYLKQQAGDLKVSVMIISSCKFQGNISLLVCLPLSQGFVAYSPLYKRERAEMRITIVCGLTTGASQLLANFLPVFGNSTRSINESYLVPVSISFVKGWMVGHVT